MPVRMRVGELAKNQGFTIKALAERAGVAYNTAHALYTARATRIDLDTLDRISAALAVEPGDLFIRDTGPEAQRAGLKTEGAMEQIQIGQRVRVNAERLPHYRQVGTVAAQGESGGWYVHLDYDDEQPGAQVFFHAEELEPAPPAPPAPSRSR